MYITAAWALLLYVRSDKMAHEDITTALPSQIMPFNKLWTACIGPLRSSPSPLLSAVAAAPACAGSARASCRALCSARSRFTSRARAVPYLDTDTRGQREQASLPLPTHGIEDTLVRCGERERGKGAASSVSSALDGLRAYLMYVTPALFSPDVFRRVGGRAYGGAERAPSSTTVLCVTRLDNNDVIAARVENVERRLQRANSLQTHTTGRAIVSSCSHVVLGCIREARTGMRQRTIREVVGGD